MIRIDKARSELLQIYNAGVSAVNGRTAVIRYLEQNPLEQACSLVALGKAASAMVLGALDVLGDLVVDGVVVSKPGHLDSRLLDVPGLTVMEGSHPVPTADSLEAGSELIRFLAGLPAERQLLFLISGGASSLVEVLHEGVDLDDLRRVNSWLLSSGLSIEKMNRVRKAMSAVKGGGLLSYVGGRNVTGLFISDVQWDDPAVIGSGLLVADENDQQAVGTMALPDWIRSLIKSRDINKPKASTQVSLHIIASLRDAREAAATAAEALGYQTFVSHAFISASAENAGRRLALELMDSLPGVYIWGGEPSVRLPAQPGRGGAESAFGVISCQRDRGFR